MGALLAIGAVILLMVIGVPVVFSFAAMTLVLSFAYDVNISSLMTTGFWSINSIILLALPLFIMTGYLMQSGGIAARLLRFVEAIVGSSRSGMGTSMVMACGIFGAISGTASAAVASIGTIMIDPMEKHGYSRPYSTALVGISSLLGLLIPPSITMILYAVVTRQSVAAVFLATIGPGILLIIFLCIINAIKMRNNPTYTPQTLALSDRFRHIGSTGWKALPALMLPVIILGGIYGGIFTPTEAAAIAVVYAIPVGMFVYRDLDMKTLARCFIQAATTTGVIMIILLFSFVASRIFTFERVPQQLTELLLELFKDKLMILLMVNIFLILMGMIMDDVSVVAILSPLLLPVMESIGVHPVHFAAIVGTSVVIGCNSPPMAPILFMSCRIGRVGMSQVIRPAFSFMLLAALPVMLITTYWPALSLFLPRLFGYVS
ncbi:TRAP transporter large permease [Billgrantia tianxiuensis]|jgi:C4-dicarboxylate transporter DctM subunit|uniref:TRAP transporter large permease protein n=1 Tax=Billgrantia tianxiuensis TaxID=2497861 RepID=A0A6I6SMG9_9GAMM|nr:MULTISPECIES: TRAP transporter large permease [Halomonas]MCE8034906.1 TRAP transporter large permease [Halomonas sp. MCCC 1A11057]QHC48565.1 TRAP transporter large permease [Halomonas tianxiuensis]